MPSVIYLCQYLALVLHRSAGTRGHHRTSCGKAAAKPRIQLLSATLVVLNEVKVNVVWYSELRLPHNFLIALYYAAMRRFRYTSGPCKSEYCFTVTHQYLNSRGLTMDCQDLFFDVH